MTNCFTCGRDSYRITINDTASAINGEKNSIKKGFFSCLTGVRNSLFSLKKAIGRSCTGLASMLHLSAPKPISVSDTRAFCDAIKLKIATNPDYVNHMFRSGKTITNSQFNEHFKDMNTLISEIYSEKIDSVKASVLVNKLIAGIMKGKKFTPQERAKFGPRTLLDRRFDHRDATGHENRVKLNLLLSVFKSYSDMSGHINDIYSDIKGPACSTDVAYTSGSELFFDYDLTRLYDRTTQKQEKAEMCRAFADLVHTCVIERKAA